MENDNIISTKVTFYILKTVFIKFFLRIFKGLFLEEDIVSNRFIIFIMKDLVIIWLYDLVT